MCGTGSARGRLHDRWWLRPLSTCESVCENSCLLQAAAKAALQLRVGCRTCSAAAVRCRCSASRLNCSGSSPDNGAFSSCKQQQGKTNAHY
jgi:hypothetical protein